MISVIWGTGEIQVPKSYLAFVEAPEVYEIDSYQFHLDLRDLHASTEGGPNTRTHNHNTTVTLSGVTYTRTIEILAPYFVTFEDGPYTVNLELSNNNILEVTTHNQVSVREKNSAGLIEVATGALTPEQAAQLQLILDILEGDENIQETIYQKLHKTTKTVLVDKVADPPQTGVSITLTENP